MLNMSGDLSPERLSRDAACRRIFWAAVRVSWCIVLIAFGEDLGSVLNEVQVAVVVWLSIGCLNCSGICRTPHGISVGLYPLLSLLRKVAYNLTSSAGLRWCGPCVLKAGSTEKSVAMWSCVLAFWYTHLCLLCCAALVSICVCQYTTRQSQCPWCTAYTGSICW